MGGFIMQNRRSFIKQGMFGAAALSLGSIPEELFANGDLLKLTVLHTNDMHYHLDPFPETHAEYPGKGGLVRIASMVSKTRKENPNTILLDAGDFFQGTPYFNYFHGDLIVSIMSKIGYDAGTLGNHEFDNGLGDIDEALKFADFPFVSSNYDFTDTILEGKIKTFHIIRKAGLKIGIYGLGIELDGLVNSANYGNTRFLDPLTTALKMENYLKEDRSCDIVICLSHLGYSYEHNKISDKSLAPRTKYTDLIIGGHTHTFLDEPLALKNSIGKQILVNQVGWGTLSLGRIDLIVDRQRRSKQAVAIGRNL